MSYEAVQEDVKFPDIELYDMQDRPVRWSQIRRDGRYTVVNVWALFCPPCIKELPSLLELKENWAGKGLDVVFIAIEYPENGAEMQQRMKDNGIPPVGGYYIRDLQVWLDLGLKGLPSSFLVGPEGQIMYRFLGDSDWSGDSAAAFFDKILGKNPKN